jgi:arginyl-tRNA synthetase
MVFKAAEASKLFHPDRVQLKHVPFGLVQGEDGKKFKSRSGETVKLKDLLDEAIRIAGEDLKLRRNLQEGIESSDVKKYISHQPFFPLPLNFFFKFKNCFIFYLICLAYSRRSKCC